MPEGHAVSQMFAGIAGRYDLANHLLSGGIDFYWRRVLSRMVHARAPRDIVDLATGSGDVAFTLRDRLGERVAIRGLDFCEPMLEEARRKRARKPGYADLEFAFGDCMISLPDQCVDAVTISFGLRNFEDRQRGLREILRVLRPGAACSCSSFHNPTGGSARSTTPT